MGGKNLLSVDFTGCKSKNDFVSTLYDFIQKNDGGWITGGAWDEQNWNEKALPKKEWIDSFTADIPVFVSRKDLHMGLANSLALKLAGITKNTLNPEGGVIEKDVFTGEPTGILKDKAMDLIFKIIPDLTEDEYSNAEQAALDEAKRFGVTSIHDITYKNHFKVHQVYEKENKLTCRISARPLIDYYRHYLDTEISSRFGSDKLKKSLHNQKKALKKGKEINKLRSKKKDHIMRQLSF
ncbi:MAG: amidohydrolase family protein, partial [Ignavibacteria bacterium]